jgi:hypothetical protein
MGVWAGEAGANARCGEVAHSFPNPSFTARLKSRALIQNQNSASQNRISRFKSWTPRKRSNHSQYGPYNHPQTNEPDTNDSVSLSPRNVFIMDTNSRELDEVAPGETNIAAILGDTHHVPLSPPSATA